MEITLLSSVLMIALVATQIAILVLFIKTRTKKEEQIGHAQALQEPKIPQLEAQLASLQDELEKARASYSAAQTELQDLKKRSVEAGEELRKYKESYSVDATDLNRLRKENAELKDTSANREQELNKIVAQLTSLQDELEKARASYSAAQTEAQDLKKRSVEAGEELRKYKESYSVDTTDLNRLRKENAELKDTSANREQELNKIVAQLTSLQDELEKARASYSAAQTELQDLKRRSVEAGEELRKYKESYSVDTTDLNRLRKENAELKDTSANREQELEKTSSQILMLEKDIKEKNEQLQVLENANKETIAKQRKLETHTQEIPQVTRQVIKEKGTKASHDSEITKSIGKSRDLENRKESPLVAREDTVETPIQLEISGRRKKKKIGEVLLEQGYITKDILDEALAYQREVGCNITQYFLEKSYISEQQLALCLCGQFGVPYLPLGSYTLSEEIMNLVPFDIAQKYLVIPIDKIGNRLIVVMANPLDTDAIKDLEELTGCKVQSFVGLLSEINKALREHYNGTSKGKAF